MSTGTLERYVECTEALNIVQSTVNGTHLVLYRIKLVDDEDLRVGGMKWVIVHFIV